MSAFGGDSWAREAQHRKRRVDDLMLSASSRSSKETSSPSFKKLSNGKYTCLVCPHNPILDTPLMLSMHNKGSRHLSSGLRMRATELSKQEESSKRIALNSDSTGLVSPGSSMPHSKHVCQNKPLIRQTRKAILEAKCNQVHRPNCLDTCQNAKLGTHSSVLQSKYTVAIHAEVYSEQSTSYDKPLNSDVSAMTEAADKTISLCGMERRERHQKELKFTAAGWKRDCHGIWYRDENVEFDSDEEDPNLCLS